MPTTSRTPRSKNPKGKVTKQATSQARTQSTDSAGSHQSTPNAAQPKSTVNSLSMPQSSQQPLSQSQASPNANQVPSANQSPRQGNQVPPIHQAQSNANQTPSTSQGAQAGQVANQPTAKAISTRRLLDQSFSRVVAYRTQIEDWLHNVGQDGIQSTAEITKINLLQRLLTNNAQKCQELLVMYHSTINDEGVSISTEDQAELQSIQDEIASVNEVSDCISIIIDETNSNKGKMSATEVQMFLNLLDEVQFKSASAPFPCPTQRSSTVPPTASGNAQAALQTPTTLQTQLCGTIPQVSQRQQLGGPIPRVAQTLDDNNQRQESPTLLPFNRQQPPIVVTNNPGHISMPNDHSQADTRRSSNSSYKLPQLNVPKYNGDLSKWKPFYDMFMSTVNADQGLTSVMKLHYLQSYLEGEAAKVTRHLEPIDSNYPIAMELLKRVFDDPIRTKTVARTALYKMTLESQTTASLRQFKIELESNLQCLESLGENLEHGHYTDLILSKLPHSMIVQLQRVRGKKPWTTKELREQLIAEIEAEEVAAIYNTKTSTDEEPYTAEALVAHNFKSQRWPTQRSKTIEQSRSQQEFKPWRSNNYGHHLQPQSNRPSSPCVFCGNQHWNTECVKYRSVNERIEQLQKQRRCFKCMQNSHSAQQCRSRVSCYYCRGAHTSALCRQRNNARPNRLNASMYIHGQSDYEEDDLQNASNSLKETKATNAIQSNVTAAALMKTSVPKVNEVLQASCNEEYTYLETAIHTVSPANRESPKLNIRGLHDTASNRSYITTKLANELQLNVTEAQNLKVEVFGSGQISIPSQRSEIQLHFPNGEQMQIKVIVVDQIMQTLRRIPLPSEIRRKIPRGIMLADPPPIQSQNRDLNLLIGQDVYHDVITGTKKRIDNGPYLLESKMGWIIAGTASSKSSNQTMIASEAELRSNSHHVKPSTKNLRVKNEDDIEYKSDEVASASSLIHDLFSLEAIGIKDSPAVSDDDVALAEFNARIEFKDNRYYVPWLWRNNADQLPTNHDLAKRRFQATVKRLSQNPEKLTKYDNIIKSQFQTGIVEEVKVLETTNRVHYISHHGVETPQKTTTKLRVVYDASAKESKFKPSGPGSWVFMGIWTSLNDCLYRGPLWLENINAILLRFRMHKVALISDIEKAYLQVGLLKSERDVTHFFWIRDITATNLLDDNNIVIYRFQRVAFGLKSSAFLLDGAIATHMINDTADKDIANDITENHYVDNIATGTSSVQEAKRYYTAAKQKLSRASMNLREWSSNSTEVTQFIPENDRASSEIVKVLGINWNTTTDQLQISTTSEKKPSDIPAKVTKRTVLSLLSQVYDPFGFLTPVTIRSRILLQSMCSDKLSWDQEVSGDHLHKFRQIHADQIRASEIKVPRFVLQRQHLEHSTLHCFSDASTKAYGTTIYLTHVSLKKPMLLYAKSRVAPSGSSKLTLPRLELMGILIGVRALKFVQASFKIQTKSSILWSDSQIALAWIDSPKVLETFVRNRVNEINKDPRPTFRYVPTEDNPADKASRGSGFDELDCSWWHGPIWLTKAEDQWPKLPPRRPSVDEGTSASCSAALAPNVTQKLTPRLNIDVKRFSNPVRLIRTAAYCMRLAKGNKENRSELSPTEIREAQILIIRQVQHDEFPELFRKTADKTAISKQLGIFTDEDGLQRCSGRLANMEQTTDAKFPILLPTRHWFTVLTCRQIHERSGHCGQNHTLAQIRQSYWIPKATSLVKSIIHHCVRCTKSTPKVFRLPKMPDLPKERVTFSPPFTHTGIDYFGHLYVFDGKNLLARKVWIALFTCLSVRAVHLELVTDMSVQQFLLALRRFMATYTVPTSVVSDNAPQFKAVAAETEKILDGQTIEWKFIVAYAPWQGGVYERMVQTVKRVLKKVLNNARLSETELVTILKEVQKIVNSRPLTALSPDCFEKVLSPSNFLYPYAIRAPGWIVPKPETLLSNKKSLVELWKKSQRLIDEFAVQWQNEYMLALRSSLKWDHHASRIGAPGMPKEGMLVMVKQEPPHLKTLWTIARIENVATSKDGKTRSAAVRFPNGTLSSRPVNLLAPLECQDFVPNVQDPDNDPNAPKASKDRSSTPPSRIQLPRQAKDKALQKLDQHRRGGV